MDLEVRGAINVVEACERTESIDKIVFSSSSLTASILRDNIGTQKDVDEKCWSDQDFCRNKKVSNLSSLNVGSSNYFISSFSHLQVTGFYVLLERL